MGSLTRRQLLAAAGGTLGAPAILRSQNTTPSTAFGVQSGDVLPGRAIVWSKTDRPAQMVVHWGTTENSARRHRVKGAVCKPENDFTCHVELTGLPSGQRIFYAVQFEDLDSRKVVSAELTGNFRTAPSAGGDLRVLFSGDTCGQGWGIDKELGGMRCYETMRLRDAHFFIHSGDNVYADGPLPKEVKLADGRTWRNLLTEEKSKVAETLHEFRGQYRYNLLDDNVRRFNAETAQFWQWDDHEVMNNWSPGKDLTTDARYTEKDILVLAGRAKRAFVEYAPMRWSTEEYGRVYRKIPYGPLLDVFMLDMRSYRAANNYNLQNTESAETAYLGAAQRDWLKRSLLESTAVWKVIAADMPLGLIVPDGKDKQGRNIFENSANTDGPPLGRELEIADLLRFMKQSRVHNTVWLTADVHYTAAHFYDPSKAQFTDFVPFWEFVSGPVHAGTFGPNPLDNTFGPQVVYQKTPPKGRVNLSPAEGMQFFGEINIESRTQEMTVTLRDQSNAGLFTKVLAPAS